ncbi:GNAT family N-acetyltransferase [Salipaludibacillus neizhouensis]|uniref:GNAT family N-acetyltransferase n=1 Tax=Salipaludibacillus neizhouensis TaxID=885475 RepID=UPI001CBA626A|nr:GNAT family N-acetyltransferase [Salipaludibacillus neizhouensis]
MEALQQSPEAFGSSFEEEKDQTAAKYKERFDSSLDAVTFGAFVDSQLVGVVTLVKEKLVKMRHRANVVAMYVTPQKRGSGIGKALLSKVIEQAKELPEIEQIYLSVVTTNESAIKLYSVKGFNVFGTEERALKFDNTYFDEHHMVRYL